MQQFFWTTVSTQIWLCMLLALAISSIMQGIQILRGKSLWAKTALPTSRRLAVFARLGGGILLLLAVVWQLGQHLQIVWAFYTSRPNPAATLQGGWMAGYLVLTGTFICILPISAVREGFLSAKHDRWLRLLKWVAIACLLLITAVHEGLAFTQINYFVDGIICAIGGPQVIRGFDPFYATEFRQELRVYNWTQLHLLAPFGILFFTTAFFGLFIVTRLAMTDRGSKLQWMTEAILVLLIMYAVLVICIAQIWPRTNPFVTIDSVWNQLSVQVTAIALSVTGGIIIAWCCSYRFIEEPSTSSTGDPHGALIQPQKILFGFLAAWISTKTLQWPWHVADVALLMIVSLQLLDVPERRERQGIKRIQIGILLRNSLLFAIALPAIAQLALLPGILLLSAG